MSQARLADADALALAEQVWIVMRHTAITALVQAGVDLSTIQKVSGQTTLAMVLRCAHVQRHIDPAIEAIGRPPPEIPANKTGCAITQEPSYRGSRGELAVPPAI
ncbi:MAG: hypothetical protein JOZ11_21940 [Alphaproteobacteria bacterium]|nr:hypothetical protein [Alphaproteobacteria bacterium]